MRKTKIVALAVNSSSNRCQYIESMATFDELKNDFALYNKNFNSTNWCGCDTVERTCREKHLLLTGREFKQSIHNSGEDNDMGHSYYWEFNADIIREVKEV